MFKKRTLVFLLITPFIFSCERMTAKPEKDPADIKKETAEAGTDHPGAPALITIKPDGIKKMGIEVGTVSFKSLKEEYAFSGKIDVNETRLAHVGPRISGRAVDIYANLGNYVKKGDRLAVIDSPELGEAQSHYLKTMSNLLVAEKSYERAKTLFDGKAISAGEFQRREAEYHSTKVEGNAAENRLHLFGLTDEEVLSIGSTHTMNSRVAIYTPISGTVIEKHLTMGEVVESVKALFVIADVSSLWVIADIPEKDIPKIRNGQETAVTVSAYPERIYRGKISYIADLINPETRTVKVRAEVENRDGTLKLGMFATMKISTGEKDALAIPDSAVQREGDKTILFIAKGANSFEKRVVELGPPLGEFREALSGVKEGERIVVKGSFTLKSESLKGLMEED